MASPFDPPDTVAAADLRQEEAQMRRNLGVEHRAGGFPFRAGERHAPARRFVRDGEVQVVVMNRREPLVEGTAGGGTPVNRLALAETALGAEQAERQRCERALHEAQANVRELQTKIGHAMLARDEALEANRLLVAENARLRAEVAAARIEPDPVTRRKEPAPRHRAHLLRATHRAEKEPKPVKWW